MVHAGRCARRLAHGRACVPEAAGDVAMFLWLLTAMQCSRQSSAAAGGGASSMHAVGYTGVVGCSLAVWL